jgi:hypothetical protein
MTRIEGELVRWHAQQVGGEHQRSFKNSVRRLT